MASAVSPVASSAAAAAASSAAASSQVPSEEMFLQLLVEQIKNQDPLNPTDSVQFVSQLAQFSELEQVIAIRTDIEGTAGAAGNTASTTDPAPSSGTRPAATSQAIPKVSS